MTLLIQNFFFFFWLILPLFGYPFSDNGDGSVTDTGTGLVWQKCSRGQNADSTCTGTATKTTWSLALLHCKNLSLGQRTWKLPNINEMRSLVNPANTDTSALPFIDPTGFPSTARDKYWSSSTVFGSPSIVYFVNFFDGSQDTQNKVTAAFVRCVSGP